MCRMGAKKTGMTGVLMEVDKKYDDVFSRLDAIHECDGQTYRHATSTSTLMCMASRGISD